MKLRIRFFPALLLMLIYSAGAVVGQGSKRLVQTGFARAKQALQQGESSLRR